MMQDLGQLDAIMSFWELSQPLVSRLCEHFNLPCNPPAAVDDARDKQVRWQLLPLALCSPSTGSACMRAGLLVPAFAWIVHAERCHCMRPAEPAPHSAHVVQKTRQKMRECGLPTPANCIIRRPEDLPGAAKQVQLCAAPCSAMVSTL